MTELLILLLVGAGGYFGYKIWKDSKKQSGKAELEKAKKQPYSPTDLRLENVDKGGVLHLTGVGPELKDMDITVLSRHIYREGEYTWYEIEGETGDGKVWIEYEEDDELEIAIKLKDLKLRELGISKSDLDRMDDEEKGSFTYKDEKFYYEDSGQAVFYRHGLEDKAEQFYYWEFENDEGDKFIGVENWSGEYESSLSAPLKPSQVTVYSINK